MKVLITQSNYIPWKGYFDALNRADVFVIFDEMQYTRRDWRNRNKIKTPDGVQWLTIPVSDSYGDSKISEIETAGQKWRAKHLKKLHHNYVKATCYQEIMDWLQPLYESDERNLSRINISFIKAINRYLGIDVEMVDVANFNYTAGKTQRLVEICNALNAATYLTGPSAADYLDISSFEKHNVEVEYLDYSQYPEYPQLFGEFRHDVTILDLLFNVGKSAPAYMKSFNQQQA